MIRYLSEMRRHASILVLFVMFAVAISHAQETKQTEQRERYLHVLKTSTLEWLKPAPFMLRADFKLFNLDGATMDAGTMEETWGNVDAQGVSFHSPTLSSSAAFPYNRETYLLKQALQSLVRPFPHVTPAAGFSLDEIERVVNGTQLDCFIVSASGTSDGTAYCTDADNRILAITGDLFVLRRTDFRKFGNHEIPMNIELSYEGRTALTVHVTELDMLTAVDHSQVENPSSSILPIAGKVIAGAAIDRKQPEYPREAKKKKIEGSVLLIAIITTQGKIRDLDVVASPNALLSKSALDAVKKWTYHPYLIEGKPVEIETTITVNYSLNRN
jgi:TonB family protein